MVKAYFILAAALPVLAATTSIPADSTHASGGNMGIPRCGIDSPELQVFEWLRDHHSRAVEDDVRTIEATASCQEAKSRTLPLRTQIQPHTTYITCSQKLKRARHSILNTIDVFFAAQKAYCATPLREGLRGAKLTAYKQAWDELGWVWHHEFVPMEKAMHARMRQAREEHPEFKACIEGEKAAILAAAEKENPASLSKKATGNAYTGAATVVLILLAFVLVWCFAVRRRSRQKN